MSKILYYILYLIISITFLYFLYIKLKYNFWSSQPIFHTYNLRDWIFPRGIIQQNLPPKLFKFHNWKINTYYFQEISTEKKALLYYFINPNLSKKQFISNFEGGLTRNHTSFLYDNMVIPQSDNNLYHTRKLISALISKSINAVINKNKTKISYIHSHKIHKSSNNKKSDFHTLLYTHYFNSRKNGNCPIFLFKKNGSIPYYTPCTTYYSYTFDTKYINIVNYDMPNNISIKQINSASFRIIISFLKEISNKFYFYTVPDFTNIKNMISTNLITPFIIMDNNNLVGILLFKNFNNKTKLFASACFPKYRIYLLKALQNSLYLLNKYKKYNTISIENISNNNYIIREILKRKLPKQKKQRSFYFYNFSIRPFISTNCFIFY